MVKRLHLWSAFHRCDGTPVPFTSAICHSFTISLTFIHHWVTPAIRGAVYPQWEQLGFSVLPTDTSVKAGIWTTCPSIISSQPANKSSWTLYLNIYDSSLLSVLLTCLLDSELLARARWCAQDANRTSVRHKSTTMAPRNAFNLVHMLPHQLVTSLGAGDDFTFAGLNAALKSLACHLNGTPKSAVPRPRVISVISDGIDLITQPFWIRMCERNLLSASTAIADAISKVNVLFGGFFLLFF